jgi:hypothetical protein
VLKKEFGADLFQDSVGLAHAPHIQPAQHLAQGASSFVHGQYIEHLGRNAHPQNLGRLNAGLVNYFASRVCHSTPEMIGVLFSPVRVRVLDAIGQV